MSNVTLIITLIISKEMEEKEGLTKQDKESIFEKSFDISRRVRQKVINEWLAQEREERKVREAYNKLLDWLEGKPTNDKKD